ncbi:virion protein US2 [Equid alphaherpesvirus 3]|uniref:Virion protein US2 n=1 Tax=Equid alphaherpesvirus 3 TaxID=80341 RepID=A0A077B9T6_9ALPH|nr:virion protein US2 [Equid alphaherpesvirus 3]AIL02986.1 virion protein US2 [Equid alphaherpesvirus 3]
MGVVLITVVTFVDKHGALPARSVDVDGHLWEFLARQCFALASEPLGIPIVARSADLYQFSARLLTLPKPCRPIVRTGGLGSVILERNGVFYYEDRPGTSTEWHSVVSGFNHLNSSVMGNRPYHLWVFGAADICRPVFDLLPGPKRLVYAELSEEWPGPSWQPPFGCGRRFPAVPWTAVGELAPERGTPADLEVPPRVARMVYAVVNRTRPGERNPPAIPAGSPPSGGKSWLRSRPLRHVPGRATPATPSVSTPSGRGRCASPGSAPTPASVWGPGSAMPAAAPRAPPAELPARGTQNPNAEPRGSEGGVGARCHTWKARLLWGVSGAPSSR